MDLPPGFGFHPSDEELMVHYLHNKVKQRSLPADVISEIELYKFDPWDLPSKALFGKDEWFFFTPRERKYPNGSRPKRSAGSGFWKATGKDKWIFASSGLRKIGVKKALAFFTGNPTKNKKTNWIMSEYRLPDSSSPSKQNGSMRLDEWVLCRVRQKGNNSKNMSEEEADENLGNRLMDGEYPTIAQELPSSYMTTTTTTEGNSNIIMSDHNYNMSIDFQLMAAMILAGHDLPTMLETLQLQGDDNNYGQVYQNTHTTFDQGWIV